MRGSNLPRTVEGQQLELLERAKRFIAKHASRPNAYMDPNFYLCSWASVIGNGKLRELAYGWRATSLWFYLQARELFAFIRSDLVITSDFPPSTERFEAVVLSWAKASDFDRNEDVCDRYFKTSTADTPNMLWVFLSRDFFIPTLPSRNVVVLSPEKSTNLRKVILRLWALLKDFRRYNSGRLTLASQVSDTAVNLVRLYGARRFVMPYEAQPFQHTVAERIRVECNGVETIGFLHSMLPALPSDFVCRAGIPKKLLVHGEGQKEILVKFLGWSEDLITVIPSLRYRVTDLVLAGYILLPYDFEDVVSLLKRFEGFLLNSKPKSMPVWKVRNHPVMARSRKHRKLIKGIESILDKYSDRMTSAPEFAQQAVLFGATAAVVEALEQKLDVFHVCLEPIFEAHVTAIWKYIKVETLSFGVYRYSLTRYGSYIQRGSGEYSFSEALSYVQ